MPNKTLENRRQNNGGVDGIERPVTAQDSQVILGESMELEETVQLQAIDRANKHAEKCETNF